MKLIFSMQPYLKRTRKIIKKIGHGGHLGFLAAILEFILFNSSPIKLIFSMQPYPEDNMAAI